MCKFRPTWGTICHVHKLTSILKTFLWNNPQRLPNPHKANIFRYFTGTLKNGPMSKSWCPWRRECGRTYIPAAWAISLLLFVLRWRKEIYREFWVQKYNRTHHITSFSVRGECWTYSKRKMYIFSASCVSIYALWIWNCVVEAPNAILTGHTHSS